MIHPCPPPKKKNQLSKIDMLARSLLVIGLACSSVALEAMLNGKEAECDSSETSLRIIPELHSHGLQAMSRDVSPPVEDHEPQTFRRPVGGSKRPFPASDLDPEDAKRQKLIADQKVILRALDLPPSPERGSHLDWLTTEAVTDLFQKSYITESEGLKHLTVEEQQLLSVHEDSKLLTEMNRHLNKELKYLESPPKFFYVENRTQLTHFVKALVELNEGLTYFKELKLLELGGIELPTSTKDLMALLISSKASSRSPKELKIEDPSSASRPDGKLPNDIINFILHKVWHNVGDLLINQIKSIMIESKSSLHPSIPSLVELNKVCFDGWKYSLTLIDFLFKNKFANTDTVRSFFQDPHLVNEIARYTQLRFDQDLGQSVVKGSPYLTQHWYWPLVHDSIKVLSKEDEHILNAYSLLDVRIKKMAKLIQIEARNLGSTRWSTYFHQSRPHRFEIQDYLADIWALDGPRRSELLKHYSGDKVTRDARRIITLISNPGHEFNNLAPFDQTSLMAYCVDLLEFINTFVSPGITKQILKENPGKFKEFDNYFNHLKLNARMEDLSSKANQYYEYIKKQLSLDQKSKWSTSKIYDTQTTFDGFLSQSINTLKQYDDEILRLRQKLASHPSYSQLFDLLKSNKSQFQRTVDDLKLKSKNLVTQ